MPALPVAPRAPGAGGHAIMVLNDSVLPQPFGSASARKVENKNVSALLSERCSVTTGRLGKVRPGLSDAIAGSFHVLIVPWYILDRISPDSVTYSVTPGRL